MAASEMKMENTLLNGVNRSDRVGVEIFVYGILSSSRVVQMVTLGVHVFITVMVRCLLCK